MSNPADRPATEPRPTETQGPHTRAAKAFLEACAEDGEPTDFMQVMAETLSRVEAEAAQGAAFLDHRIEWTVMSDDGEVYEVEGKTREKAEYEAALLREPDEDGHAEPGAHVVMRKVCEWMKDLSRTDLSEGAAPRAEGLDVPSVEVLEVALREGLGFRRGHATIYIAGQPLDSLTAAERLHNALARLSRLSDERVPESEER